MKLTEVEKNFSKKLNVSNMLWAHCLPILYTILYTFGEQFYKKNNANLVLSNTLKIKNS